MSQPNRIPAFDWIPVFAVRLKLVNFLSKIEAIKKNTFVESMEKIRNA